MSRKSISIIAVAAILIVTAVLMQGCGHYPTVSQETYQHAKALYSVCNRKDGERLAVCSNMIEKAANEKSITSSEASYLQEIVAAAEADQWAEAQQMARQLMSDQAGN